MKLVHSGIILGLAVAGVAVVACSGSKTTSTGSEGNTAGHTTGANSGSVGSLHGSLTVGTENIATVTWTITNTNNSASNNVVNGLYADGSAAGAAYGTNSDGGIGGFAWNGSVDVSNSGSADFTVGALGAGSGYNIVFGGKTVDGQYTCVASAPFTITAGTVTHLTVGPLVCTPVALAATTGSIQFVMGVQLNPGCAVVTGVSGTPEDIIIPIDGGAAPLSYLTASAQSSQSTDTIGYTWTSSNANIGTLNNANTQSPTFLCKNPGTTNLSVTAADVSADGAVSSCSNTVSYTQITCEGACNPPNLTCTSSCINPATDPNNCGSCNHVCGAAPANATESCTNGNCVFTCNTGYTNCSGSCVNVQDSDVNNCGACGSKCATGQVCTTGQCVTPPQTVQTMCNNFLGSSAASSLKPVNKTTCSGTEVALYEHDVVKNPTTAPCLACALGIGCLDDTVGDTMQECEDYPTPTLFGNVAECIAEVQCGVGLPLTGCTASDTNTSLCPIATTSLHQSNGNQVNNLFCGTVASAACQTQTPATSLPGTCVTPWLNGVPAADSTAAGGVALGDGAGTKTAAGVGNSILTCLVGNCVNQCMLQ
jgi:hypothetical protein